MKIFLLTIVGLVALTLVAHLYLVQRFVHFAQALEAKLYQAPPPAARTDLPAIVQVFAERGMAATTRLAAHVTLRQAAEMRRSKGADWLSLSARQVVRTDQPGFVWTATQKLGPLVMVRVIDSYVEGRGLLDVRLLGWIRLGRETGPEADRGEAMRYLAELAWTPDAILANHAIIWQQLAPNRVRASLELEDGPASVEFLFDEAGDITEIVAKDRPARDQDGKPVVLDWQGYVGEYATLGARRIPLRAEVGYVYPDGYEAYWRGRITAYEPGGG